MNKKIFLILGFALVSCVSATKVKKTPKEEIPDFTAELEQVKAAARNSLLKDQLDFSTMADLHYAAGWGSVALVRYILERDGQVDVLDGGERTPLFLASGFNNQEMLGYLLQQGADVNQVNDLGSAPLHWAAGSSALPQTKFLLEHGAQLKALDKVGRTALDVAHKPPRLEIESEVKEAEILFLQAAY